MGFQVFDLGEIEKDYYCFEALNMPRNHPARDSQDTFYFDDTMLLRTHCTSVDVHAMESMRPPIRAVTPGRSIAETHSMPRILPCFSRST